MFKHLAQRLVTVSFSRNPLTSAHLFQGRGDESLLVAEPECMFGVVSQVSALQRSGVDQHGQLAVVQLVEPKKTSEKNRLQLASRVHLPHWDLVRTHRLVPGVEDSEVSSLKFFGKLGLDFLSEFVRELGLVFVLWVPVGVEVVAVDRVRHGSDEFSLRHSGGVL